MGKRVYRKKRRKGRIDGVLLGVTAILIIIGIIMVFSSSAIVAEERYRNMYFFVFRQVIWAVMGAAALGAGLLAEPRKISALSRPAIFISLLLLIAVLIPFIGHTVGGARRWIRMGPVGFQPAEFSKIAVVLYMASVLDRKFTKVGSFSRDIVPPLLIVLITAALIYKQPDFGTAALILVIAGIMLFLGGARIKHLAISGGIFILAAAYALLSYGYRRDRLLTFLRPFESMYGSGFQLSQSLTALGAGGISGVGLGAGYHKLFFLPEVHTDFVFSVLGQETGFIGAILVVFLFIVFTLRGMRIALRHSDYLSRITAAGLTLLISLQAVINIGVVTGTLPTKGLSLPFISFGGSSLFFNMFAVGVLLNLSRGVKDRAG